MVIKKKSLSRAQPGKRFGLLTIKNLISGSKRLGLRQRATCSCACGTKNVVVRVDGLVSGRTSSCGCRFGHNGKQKIKNHPFSSLRPDTPSRRVLKKYMFDGRSMSLKQISEKTGIPIQILFNRIFYRGWSPEMAFSVPRTVKTYRKKIVQEPEIGYDIKWRRRNPKKLAAQKAIQAAILSGRIDRKPCSVCGDPKSQGHHPDYDKFFEVIWLCAAHHNEWHRTNGEGKNADTPFPSTSERKRINGRNAKIELKLKREKNARN